MTTASDASAGRGGRQLPTDWDAPYLGVPPWDIGRPQAPFVELAEAGGLHGSVLELGCGTGEHTLLAAAQGLDATGVDLSPRAIARARAKAAERDLTARFLVLDALRVDSLDQTFDVVLDCGFFHVLSDHDRQGLAEVLRQVMSDGGEYHLLCFSDRVPGDAGPRRIHRHEIESAFRDGFAVETIDGAYIEATFIDDLVPAWMARIRREVGD